ncbi:ankyrin repeat protein, partial [Leptodontidium sp. 2 PMI_412]
DINTRNKDGITAFLWAASTGNTALGLMLAQRGVDTSEATEGKGTALHFAASGGHLEFLDFLLNPEALTRQINGLTPFLFAAWEGQRDTVALLLKHGSKITAIDDDGWTALHLSVYNEHIEVVKLL